MTRGSTVEIAVTRIFTIGHSRFTAEHFTSLLRTHAIERLVDVRSQPASRFSPQFGKARLQALLAGEGIDYVWLGNELGGRLPEGVDYARRMKAPDFRAGIDRLVELGADRRTVILCAEEDPAKCHRRLLVTPPLLERVVEVVHIRKDARLEDEPRRLL